MFPNFISPSCAFLAFVVKFSVSFVIAHISIFSLISLRAACCTCGFLRHQWHKNPDYPACLRTFGSMEFLRFYARSATNSYRGITGDDPLVLPAPLSANPAPVLKPAGGKIRTGPGR
jgi:hypothetical protein